MKHAEAQKKATKQVVGLYSNQYSKIGKMVDKHRKKTRKALGLDTAETKLEAIRQRKERMKQRQKEINHYQDLKILKNKKQPPYEKEIRTHLLLKDTILQLKNYKN